MSQSNCLPQIQKALKNQETTCSKLVESSLNTIQEHRHLNAFLEVFEEEARSQADLIDRKIAEGKAGKLHGLVVGIKDVLCYSGHVSSAGSKALSGFESIITATAVKRLIEEDAIIIGRQNCDEFGMGSTNENSAYGPVLNGADENKVPGGSSGGSAVAVQMDMCHASLGTDTGGSVRTPASFCGVVGLKPTYGRVSRHGLIAYASSFDQIGILAKNVENAAIILEVISGKDPMDSTSSDVLVPGFEKKDFSTNDASVACFTETLNHHGLDAEIASCFKGVTSSLASHGTTIENISFPYFDFIVPAYYVLTMAESSSNLARYDGIHYGHRSRDAKDIEEVYIKSRTESFGKEVKRRIMMGTFVLSSGYYDAYYSKAQKVRRQIKEFTEDILSKHDFIMLPTTPSTAFNLGEKTKNPVEMYLADIFTVHANLTGLPAISLPVGKHSNSLPFGIQIIGSAFREDKLLAFSEQVMFNHKQFQD